MIAASRGRTVAAAVAAWAVLLVAVRVWGLYVLHHNSGNMALGAVPLFGEWDLRLGLAAAVLAVIATAAVLGAGRVASSAPWPALLAIVALAAAAWVLALGGVDGSKVLGQSIQRDYAEHVHYVDDAGGPHQFLQTYVARQPGYPVHLQAHPPGMTLGLWLAEQVGVKGPVWYIAMPVLATALAAVAVLLAFDDVAGRALARRAAPFVVLAPAAVWRVNADAVFAGPVCAGLALLVLATSRQGRRGDLFALAGGLLFGGAMFLSYGVAALVLPGMAVARWRRRWRPLVLFAVATVAVVLAPLLFGFWWLDGLRVTRHQYAITIASVRPYSYFVIANLGVAALALGPATAAGLTALRGGGRWLVGGALVALLAVDISGLSKSEVERIWQPFFPLLLLAGAYVAVDERSGRRWLAAQATVAVVLQCTLRSPW
ncbi:MAG: hypothetical protein JWL70_162 [Acidimicrobiia bacterium]|nr:hypothetical protein [Acidimicrobiia bacterium]